MAAVLVFLVVGGYAVFSILLIGVFVWNTPKRWYLRLLTGVITTLIATLPVTTMYWEYLQTKRSFERYCKEEAKVEIFKAVEQWKKENPGVAETLKAYTDKNKPPYKSSGDGLYNTSSTDFLNPRFARLSKENGPLPANVFREVDEIIDTKTGEVMARLTDYRSGYGNPFLGTPYGLKSYKMWLATPNCASYNRNMNIFFDYMDSLKNIGGKQQ